MRRLCVILLVLGATACVIPNRPWRTSAAPLPDKNVERLADTSIERLRSDPRESKAVEPFAEERLEDGTAHAVALHEIEFDDQGRFWNRSRAEESLKRIAAAAEAKGGARIVVFSHGWDNNARVCNGKLTCFRELLQLFQQDEHRYAEVTNSPERAIVGVYIGWRGRSVSSVGFDWTGLPGLKAIDLKYLTFWSRKAVAEAIGSAGAATEVLERLNGMRCRSTDGPDCRTSVIFMGHSFGGQLIFRASAGALNEQLSHLHEPDQIENLQSRRARPYYGFGDLIILENPALEAEQYNNIDALVREFKPLNPYQLPLFMTISSEGDTANSILFPVGRLTSSLLQSARDSEQWQAMMQSIGSYATYHTHQLLHVERRPPAASHRSSIRCACEDGLAEQAPRLIDALEPFYRGIKKVKDAAFDTRRPPNERAQFVDGFLRGFRLAAFRRFLYSQLEPSRAIDENVPFMIVRVDRDIIKDHSDLFNPGYVDFLTEYIRLAELKAEILRQHNFIVESVRTAKAN